MFNLKNFIVKNLVDGTKNGTFTKEYANIAAVNYLAKGMLDEEGVIAINAHIEEWEAAKAVAVPEDYIPVEPEEDVTVEEPEVTEEPEEPTEVLDPLPVEEPEVVEEPETVE